MNIPVIHTIDLMFRERAQAVCCYLVEAPAGPVLVECGPTSTLPRVLTQLAKFGYQASDIRHVLLTHIHLDHAGASGWWAAQGAQIYVHPLGAPHLIDPSRLWASASRIYGDAMETLWGTLQPVPAAQVTVLNDNARLTVNDWVLDVWETPGHANHHLLYADPAGQYAFTGDVAGVCIPGVQFQTLPAPPPEFDPERWMQSLARLQQASFKALYLTHFGVVTDVAVHLQNLTALLQQASQFVGDYAQQGETAAEILPKYRAFYRQRALLAHLSPAQWDAYEAANPLDMSVHGILRYWQKRAAAQHT
jgi:glyoxylase-like metal-dependent hydrolase (beta-lactamase superfamily II)